MRRVSKQNTEVRPRSSGAFILETALETRRSQRWGDFVLGECLFLCGIGCVSTLPQARSITPRAIWLQFWNCRIEDREETVRLCLFCCDSSLWRQLKFNPRPQDTQKPLWNSINLITGVVFTSARSLKKRNHPSWRWVIVSRGSGLNFVLANYK